MLVPVNVLLVSNAPSFSVLTRTGHIIVAIPDGNNEDCVRTSKNHALPGILECRLLLFIFP